MCVTLGKQILILGGGFGGLAASHELRNGLSSEHKITLVDRQPIFLMGLTKLWILNGTRGVGETPGNRTSLTRRGIDFLEGEVNSIDLKNRKVQVGKQHLPYDYLIIALGAEYSIASTPGFSEFALNLYTESGCAEIRDSLQSFDSGTLTILVCGLPFKCPPAPYEATMIIDDVLRKRGVREKIRLQIVTPEPHPLTILGLDAGKRVVQLLEERSIDYHPSHKVSEIRKKRIMTEDGKQIQSDLIFAIPVHVVPPVLREAGLVDQSGWVPVNSSTMETSTPQVYAIGDSAGTKIPKGSLLPRAGVLAEEQGKVVARNIVHEIEGRGEPTTFAGKGACYLEVGSGKAALVKADFYAQPSPTWEFSAPNEEGYSLKQRFLKDRIEAWFL
jgi:sulfide:quinone oxidoreductase